MVLNCNFLAMAGYAACGGHVGFSFKLKIKIKIKVKKQWPAEIRTQNLRRVKVTQYQNITYLPKLVALAT